MLEVLTAAAAFLLAAVGVAVLAGPALPRALRRLRDLRRQAAAGAAGPRLRFRLAGAAEPEAAPAVASPLHPTTLRALTASARLYGLLRAAGHGSEAAALRASARQVRSDEAAGLLALARTLRALRSVALDDGESRDRYARTLDELQRAVRDRAEQLELLHLG